MCDEHSPFWHRREHVAALNHRCDECWRPIMRDERYVSTTGKWDGEVETFRAHVLCDMLADKVCREEYCRMLGMLSEFVKEVDLTQLQARWWESLSGERVGADDDEAEAA